MSILRARMNSRYSNEKLRRARKLYGLLCSKAIHAQPETAIPLAFRAKEYGLYSESTSINDVCFSLMRYAYKNHPDKGSWWNWAKDNKAEYLWLNCSSYYRKKEGKLKVLKKPRMRIAA